MVRNLVLTVVLALLLAGCGCLCGDRGACRRDCAACQRLDVYVSDVAPGCVSAQGCLPVRSDLCASCVSVRCPCPDGACPCGTVLHVYEPLPFAGR